MGTGWRVWKEKVRESIPGTNVDMTSNARNRAMMKTATDFSLQVKKCERAIRGAHAANAELLGTTKATMTLALPQTYDDSNAGAGGTAVVALHMVGGPNFNSDAVSRVTNESGHKLETEVLAPLQRWQDVHGQLAARFRDLEKTRLELDSRRRTVTDMSSKVSGMRAKLGASGGGAKTEQKLDSTIRILSHKEAKLKVTTQNFDQQEALLARDLAALIADGQYLKHYVAAALRLQGGALLGAADAFGELTSAPAPSAPSPSGTPTSATAGASGVAGFGAVPPAVALSGPPSRTTSDVQNPYHNGASMASAAQTTTAELASDPRYNSANSTGTGGSAKRYSEPQEQVGGGGSGSGGNGAMAAGMPAKGPQPAAAVTAARYPAAPQESSDNPYSSVRGYSYA